MSDQENNDYIRIRISSEDKKRFKDVCQQKSINGSELIRKLIIDWLNGKEPRTESPLQYPCNGNDWHDRYLKLEQASLKNKEELKRIIEELQNLTR